ncbi:MAG: ribonuclease III [Chloroflexi bacterium]|nr:ribonuclease III [Chloroflexota bacterium]
MQDLDNFQTALGVSFKDVSLLQQALAHSSYVNENPGFAAGSNERLEFLGDAVLGLVIAEKLYRDFPEISEGQMTKLRSALVRRDTLAGFARSISLGGLLYLGRGEETSGGREKTVNLAGALEALIAAVFLDRGLETARDFILRLSGSEINRLSCRAEGLDYKSCLQEMIQSRRQVTPVYRIVEAVGPDHEKIFTVEVLAGSAVLGTGSGRSKKLAEVEAARLALERLDFTLRSD